MAVFQLDAFADYRAYYKALLQRYSFKKRPSMLERLGELEAIARRTEVSVGQYVPISRSNSRWDAGVLELTEVLEAHKFRAQFHVLSAYPRDQIVQAGQQLFRNRTWFDGQQNQLLQVEVATIRDVFWTGD